MKRRIPRGIGFMIMVTLGACARKEATSTAVPPPQPTVKATLPSALPGAEPDPLVKTQLDVGIEAVTEGSRLRVAVENRTNKPLLIGPKNFGLLYAGEKEVVPFKDPEAGFPPVKVNPGDQSVGTLPLRPATGEISKARLVFNHPECRPALARIMIGSVNAPSPAPATP